MFRKQKCIYMYKYKPCNLHFIDPILDFLKNPCLYNNDNFACTCMLFIHIWKTIC